MSRRIKSHARPSRLRTLGAVACLAVAGVGVPVLATYAQAGNVPSVEAISTNTPPNVTNAALPHRKLPAGAVPMTHLLPKPGAYGAAFQASVANPASQPAPYVVGGAQANAADYPWIVGIETNFLAQDENGNPQWYTSYCTGTVLSPTKVLTAGHCATEMAFGATVVIAGRNNLDTGGSGFVSRVTNSWTHQGFNLAALNAGTTGVPLDDVSVLTLQQALPAVYTPVTLTAQGDQTPYVAGRDATIVGYGVTTPSGNDPGVLYAATVQIQSNALCTSAMPGYDSIRMVCAGTPAGGVGVCHGDSGGPLLVAGVQVGITDWGSNPCATAGTYGVFERLSNYSNSVRADLARPPLVNLDWSGDGHSDLMARDGAGNLIEYSGSGFADDGYGGFAGNGNIGTGWNIYSKLFRTTNWNGDGYEAIFAMDPAGGLYQYAGNGVGGFATGVRVLIGSGWNCFSDIMVVNNWTGDGHPNLLGRTPAGDLYLYTSDGHGGWLNGGVGIKIGNGWNSFNTVLTPGTWSGDGRQALIGRTPAGDLYLYKSDGRGGWLNGGVGIKIGNGWNGFTIFMSPGDWNGDNQVDLIGVTPAGVMFLYKTDGYGAWLNNGEGQQVSTGWNVYNTIF